MRLYVATLARIYFSPSGRFFRASSTSLVNVSGSWMAISDSDLRSRITWALISPAMNCAVPHPAHPAGGVDADDPQPAELPLPHPAVAEGVLPAADQRDDRLPVQVVPAQPEPLGQLPGAGALPEDRLAATGAHGSESPRGLVEACRVTARPWR